MGFITPDMLDPETPTATSSGGSFITPDMLDPLPVELSGSQKFAGGLANMIPLNLGDELMAGIRTGVDVLQGRPMGESYDANLAEIRQYEQAFENERPIMAGATSLAGNAPLFAVVPSGVAAAPTLGTKMGQAAIESAGWGGAFGFGRGEGGLQNRTVSAAEDALVGEVAGPAGVLIGKGLSAGADRLKSASQGMARKAVGARYNDYRKTANDLGIFDAPDGSLQTLTKASLDDALEKGQLGFSRDPGKMLQKVDTHLDDLREEVGAAIRLYDEVGTNAPVFPKFPNALEYLAKGKVPADKVDRYAARLAGLEQEIAAKGNGSLQYLQQQKISVGKDFKPTDQVEAGFIRAVYTDLQKAIEKAVPQVGPLNKELQKFEIIKPILRDGLAKAENQTAASRGLDLIKTTGGVGVPLIAGSNLGAPLLAGAGALAYMAGATPTGQRATSAVLGGASKLAGALAAPVAERGGQIAASQLPALLGTERPLSDSSRPDIQESSLFRKEDAKVLEPTARSPQGKQGKGSEQSASLFPSSYSSSVFDKDQSLSEPSVFAKLSKAVEKIESGGKADAVSNKGAVGTHQVRPIAMREVMRRQGIDDSALTDADLTAMAKRPGVSKRFGEAYLQMLVDQYDGDVELALAAYNAGPTLVDRLLKGDADTFADIRGKLPAETQAYVPKVRSVFEKI